MILDIGGNRPLSQLRRALTPRGTLVIVGAETGGRWLGGSDRQLRALMLSPFTGQTLTTLICSENTQDLQALTELIESGQVQTGHRPDLPAEPDPRGHPVHAGRPRPGQGRHQPLNHDEEHAERSGVTPAPSRFPLAAQSCGRSREGFIERPLGEAFGNPGNLGEQVGPPPASSRSTATAALRHRPATERLTDRHAQARGLSSSILICVGTSQLVMTR